MQEFLGERAKLGEFEGENFARECQTASICPLGQNAETKFSSSLFEFFGGARNPKIEEEKFVEA
jgi:hypothetical protein